MPLHQIFFYLTIVLLPTQLGYHFWPEWALVLGRRLDYLSPTIFLTDITMVATLIIWILSNRKNFQRTKIHIHKKIIIPFIFLLSFFILNICIATSPLIAFSKWVKVLEFGLFGVYIIKTKPLFSRSIGCLSVGVLYSSCIALTQFVLQHSIGGLLWLIGERTFSPATPGIAKIQTLPFSFFLHFYELRSMNYELIRPYATFPHPNVLGGFLALTIPMIIDQKLSRKNYSSYSLYYLFVVTLGIMTLILTFSRTAWFAFISFMVVLQLSKYTKKNLLQKKSMLFITLFLLLVCIFGYFSFPYFQTLTSANESVFVRNDLNIAAIKIFISSTNQLKTIISNLLFGVGLGNFLVKLPTIYPHRDIFFLQPVHNIYLLLLSEVGIIGLLLFLWFIYKILWHRKLIIIHYSLFIILLIGLVDHYPLTLQQGQLLFTVLLSFAIYK